MSDLQRIARPPLGRLAGLAVLTILSCRPSAAAELCVDSSQALTEAFALAGGNGESDEVRIVEGDYPAPASGWSFVLQPTDTATDLSVTGEWNSDCTDRMRGARTVLLGEDSYPLLQFESDAQQYWSGIAVIEGLVLSAARGTCGSGALSFEGTAHTGALILDRLTITGNAGHNGVALCVTQRGSFRLSNSVISDNHVDSLPVFVSLSGNAGGDFVNNTIVDNSASSAGLSGLYIQGFAGNSISVANNVLWNNHAAGHPGLDLRCEGNLIGQIDTNILGAALCSGPASNANLATDPGLDSAWVPKLQSSARNAGRSEFSLGMFDLIGNHRIVGSAVDIGAMELSIEPVFGDGFEN